MEWVVVGYCAVGIIAAATFNHIDDYMLRAARRVAARLGNVLDVDRFAIATAINRFARPLAVACTIILSFDLFRRQFAESPGTSILAAVFFYLLPYSWRSCFYEPDLAQRVAKEATRSSLSGALDFALWRELRNCRRLTATLSYLFLLPAPSISLKWVLACAFWLLSLAFTLFLSIDQPPYSYVSIRERIARMRLVLTPARAA